MKKGILATLTAILLIGCASISQQARDATARDLRVHPDSVEVHDARVSGLSLDGRTRVTWRAWVDDIAYDCSGYQVESSTCMQSPDQSPVPMEE